MPKQPRYGHTYQELVKAHAQLQAVVTGELPLPVDERTKEQLLVANNVICWVLGHHEGLTQTLKAIDDFAKANGYALVDKKGQH